MMPFINGGNSFSTSLGFLNPFLVAFLFLYPEKICFIVVIVFNFVVDDDKSSCKLFIYIDNAF